MPKFPVDYSNTVIYKIVCKDTNITESYVGHTTNLIKRKGSHQSTCNNPKSPKYNLYVYQFIRNNGGFTNWSILVVEKYPCVEKIEALVRERYWLEQLQATLNRSIPSRTQQEYNSLHNKDNYERNKESLLKQMKIYRADNAQKIKEQMSQQYECDCGGKYTYANYAKHCRTVKHQNYLKSFDMNTQYDYYCDGTPCTKKEYEYYTE